MKGIHAKIAQKVINYCMSLPILLPIYQYLSFSKMNFLITTLKSTGFYSKSKVDALQKKFYFLISCQKHFTFSIHRFFHLSAVTSGILKPIFESSLFQEKNAVFVNCFNHQFEHFDLNLKLFYNKF